MENNQEMFADTWMSFIKMCSYYREDCEDDLWWPKMTLEDISDGLLISHSLWRRTEFVLWHFEQVTDRLNAASQKPKAWNLLRVGQSRQTALCEEERGSRELQTPLHTLCCILKRPEGSPVSAVQSEHSKSMTYRELADLLHMMILARLCKVPARKVHAIVK